MSEDNEDQRDIFGELVPAANASVAIADEISDGLGNVTSSLANDVGSGLPFIGISKQGSWKFGPDDIAVESDDTLAIDLRTVRHGYVVWVDGKPNERMVAASEDLPPVHELPNMGKPWQLAISMEMVFVGGDMAGTKVIYKNNSLGGRKAVSKLLTSVKVAIKADPSKRVPLIRLDTDGYKHKEHGDIVTPVFHLVGFVDGRKGPQLAASKPAEVEPPKAAAKQAAAPAEAPAAGRRRRVG